MIYAYHPSALLEAAGAINAHTFNLELHNRTALVGLLTAKGFQVRGDLNADVQYIAKYSKLPDQISFYHQDVTEAFLNYVPELDELILIEGTHPDLGVEISTYSALDILSEWADIDQDEICARMLTELGELEDSEVDEVMLRDLESCFPLTDEQREQLGALILSFMDYHIDGFDEPDPDEAIDD